MNKYEEFNKLILNSHNIIFFGGAGVSTESGIPDFRSKDGLYNMKYDYPPEEILSHHFFMNNTKEFYDFYFHKMIYHNIKPNECHLKLALLEKKGKLKGIITQNIDSLHEDAGSKKIIKLHGSVGDNYCLKCHQYYNLDDLINNGYHCSCGGIIKPDVVLYEEGLNEDNLKEAIKLISEADLLIVGGTSLNVYPAAGLIKYFEGANLVIINKDPTNYDKYANLVINDSLGKVFQQIPIK